MRTTEEIKKEMTDAALANATLCDAFGLDPSLEWDGQVSKVSVLNLIIYIVAMAARTVEWLHDQFRTEVEERIAAALPGTVSWYWNKIMQFQYGHALNAMGAYDQDDPEARIIKHCAVFEADNGIIVKVNKGADSYEPLTTAELEALKAYVAAVKFAGTTARVFTASSDQLSLSLNIWRDPMTLDAGMNRIADGQPVIEQAVKEYLDGIAYGGVLNKTRLIDAVQSVPGVRDVTIASGSIYTPGDGNDYSFDGFGQNFRSVAGHFTLDGEHAGITFNDMNA